MTSAERAEEICRLEESNCEENGIWVPSSVFQRMQAAITTAILEAENAKLEEAAAKIGAECEVYGQRLEMSDLEAEVFGSPDGVKKVIKQVQGALEGIPESIRSLISKKD